MFLQGEVERRWQIAAVPCQTDLHGTAKRVCSMSWALDVGKHGERHYRTAQQPTGSGCAMLLRVTEPKHCWQGAASAVAPAPWTAAWQNTSKTLGAKNTLVGEESQAVQSLGERSWEIWSSEGKWEAWCKSEQDCRACCAGRGPPPFCMNCSMQWWYLPHAWDLYSYGKIIFASSDNNHLLLVES